MLRQYLLVASSGAPVLWIARRELHASKLAPLGPVAGSKILLSVFRSFNRLSFTHKVTARNIRYKQTWRLGDDFRGGWERRFAGRGILGSLDGIADRQFKKIITYDAIVSKDTEANEETDKPQSA